MPKARLVITAVAVEKRPVSEVARTYGVARSWIYTLLARYQAESEAAFGPRPKRPKTSPNAISDETIDLIVRLRKDLAGQGLDAGPSARSRPTSGSLPSSPTNAGSPTSLYA
jgi:transposase-like protein